MIEQICYDGEFQLPICQFSPPANTKDKSYYFKGWSLTPTGAPLTNWRINVQSNITLYAIWDYSTFKPTYIYIDGSPGKRMDIVLPYQLTSTDKIVTIKFTFSHMEPNPTSDNGETITGDWRGNWVGCCTADNKQHFASLWNTGIETSGTKGRCLFTGIPQGSGNSNFINNLVNHENKNTITMSLNLKTKILNASDTLGLIPSTKWKNQSFSYDPAKILNIPFQLNDIAADSWRHQLSYDRYQAGSARIQELIIQETDLTSGAVVTKASLTPSYDFTQDKYCLEDSISNQNYFERHGLVMDDSDPKNAYLTFTYNGKEVGMQFIRQEVAPGDEATIPNFKPVIHGKEISQWKDTKTGVVYDTGAQITLSKDTTLEAVK